MLSGRCPGRTNIFPFSPPGLGEFFGSNVTRFHFNSRRRLPSASSLRRSRRRRLRGVFFLRPDS